MAINGSEADDVLIAKVGDGALNERSARCAFANLTRQFVGEPRIGGLADETESLHNLMFGNDPQEGRLFELRG